MADEQSLKNLIESAIEEVNVQSKSFESTEIEEEMFRDTLPDDCTYHIETLCGVQATFKDQILFTNDNVYERQR